MKDGQMDMKKIYSAKTLKQKTNPKFIQIIIVFFAQYNEFPCSPIICFICFSQGLGEFHRSYKLELITYKIYGEFQEKQGGGGTVHVDTYMNIEYYWMLVRIIQWFNADFLLLKDSPPHQNNITSSYSI